VNGFEAYKLYLSVKSHFDSNNDYNYVKYGGKTRTPKVSTYQNRRDRYFFEKLGQKRPTDLLQFYVANFVEEETMWVGDMDSSTSETHYVEWKKRVQSLSYLFEQEAKDIKQFVRDRDITFDELFKVNEGEHPVVFRFLLQKMISIETYILLDKVLGFSEMFKKKITERYVYPELQYKCDRYAEFMNFNVKQYEKIMKGVFVNANE